MFDNPIGVIWYIIGVSRVAYGITMPAGRTQVARVAASGGGDGGVRIIVHLVIGAIVGTQHYLLALPQAVEQQLVVVLLDYHVVDDRGKELVSKACGGRC